MLDHKRLLQLLTYDPDTGEFSWKATGNPAGANKKWYAVIGIDGRNYYAHRLAWFYVTGCWPAACIDHIDLDRRNNAFANLRAATHSENMRNSRVRSHNKCGFKGVSQEGNRYRAQISINGRTRKLGSFKTAVEAHEVYCKEAARISGSFARAA